MLRVDVDATDCATNGALLGIQLGIADGSADDGALFDMELGADGGTADGSADDGTRDFALLVITVLLLVDSADGCGVVVAADCTLLVILSSLVCYQTFGGKVVVDLCCFQRDHAISYSLFVIVIHQ